MRLCFRKNAYLIQTILNQQTVFQKYIRNLEGMRSWLYTRVSAKCIQHRQMKSPHVEVKGVKQAWSHSIS